MDSAMKFLYNPYVIAVGIAAGTYFGLELIKPPGLYDSDGKATVLDAKIIAIVVLASTLGYMHFKKMINLPIPGLKRASPMFLAPPMMTTQNMPPPAMNAMTTSMRDLLSADQFDK